MILAVISNVTYKINIDYFRKYCLETAKRYVSLYKWYHMPPSLHIILIHGYQILENFDVPCGSLSEEAQESRNKNIKRFREDLSRKMTR